MVARALRKFGMEARRQAKGSPLQKLDQGMLYAELAENDQNKKEVGKVRNRGLVLPRAETDGPSSSRSRAVMLL